jgi:hypothetical protein
LVRSQSNVAHGPSSDPRPTPRGTPRLSKPKPKVNPKAKFSYWNTPFTVSDDAAFTVHDDVIFTMFLDPRIAPLERARHQIPEELFKGTVMVAPDMKIPRKSKDLLCYVPWITSCIKGIEQNTLPDLPFVIRLYRISRYDAEKLIIAVYDHLKSLKDFHYCIDWWYRTAHQVPGRMLIAIRHKGLFEMATEEEEEEEKEPKDSLGFSISGTVTGRMTASPGILNVQQNYHK